MVRTILADGDQTAGSAFLHPALLHVLRGAEELGLARFDSTAQTMEALLRAGLTDQPIHGQWSASLLTTTGFPVEFAWCSTTAELRYTLEPGSGVISPHQRLDLVSQWGKVAPFSFELFKELQHGCSLRYGAWIGVRHQAEQTSYKYYLEIPINCNRDKIYKRCNDATYPLPTEKSKLTMLGIDPKSTHPEFYYQTIDLQPRDVESLMGCFGIGDRAGELLHTLESLYGWPVYKKLPGKRHGFSYRTGLSQEALFTFYLYACDVFASDAHARQALLHQGRTREWDTRFYEYVSAPLKHSTRTRAHGLVGITLGKTGEAAVSVGLSPLCSIPTSSTISI